MQCEKTITPQMRCIAAWFAAKRPLSPAPCVRYGSEADISRLLSDVPY